MDKIKLQAQNNVKHWAKLSYHYSSVRDTNGKEVYLPGRVKSQI